MARAGDVVWGSGVNGKLVDREHALSDVDVRAVRGPRTRDFARRRGAEVPEVYGDPGLLVGHLWTRSALAGDRPRTDHLVVPNLHDLAAADRAHPTLSPRSPLDVCLGTIAASGFVVASSLHGVVVADALGVPARFVRSAVEPELKYRDYLEGTGRADVEIAETVEDALRLGPHPPPAWDPGPLLRAFPAELWGLRTVVEAARPVSGGPLAHGPTTGGNAAERRAWSGQRTGEGPGAGQGAGLHGLS
ncbi:polysaccharide pyruvyl transferase family protein [Cellulosimicrobium sp. CUA-896]|uniref:polysaccharide pyruvyl transferase family protein n=1 Tax=Cellulosimicrobium sp. CUA-896 TaxID=1517881 RepID=UPI00210144D6|nr:polysaccharide pyruvyl transferase family protein [Cellulosimicrobium sp. CUA-896]